MQISVITVNYQSEHFLNDCFESLKKAFGSLDYEIIIVNNDNKALNSSLADNFKNLTIITCEDNNGYAKACNLGAMAAKGEFLFFLNPDTKIINFDIDGFFQAFKDKSIGIVAPKLILPSGENQPWSSGRELNFWSLLANNLRKKKAAQPDLDGFKQNEKIDWVSGAAFFMPKKIFDSVGGFDENYFMYFEDIDLCRKTKLSGYRIIKMPQASVLHIGGQSYSSSKTQKKDYYVSQDYYFKKNFGFLVFFTIKTLRIISSLAKKFMSIF